MKYLILSLITVINLLPTSNQAANITLAWNPNPDTNVVGYKIYYGTTSGNYTHSITVGNVTQYTVTNLINGQTYYLAATCYTRSGIESTFSNEASKELKLVATISASNTLTTYTGQPVQPTIQTTPNNLPFTVTFNGSTNLPINVGTYTVEAISTNSSLVATATMTIEPEPITVNPFNCTQIADGTPKHISIATQPANAPIHIQYSSTPTSPGNYPIKITSASPNYTVNITTTLTLVNANHALHLSWPASSRPALYTSSDLKTWTPLNVNTYLTNEIVLAKLSGNHFFRASGNTPLRLTD